MKLKELIDGLLLGDGNLYVDKRKINPTPIYQHTDNNKEYLLYLKKCFESFGLSFSGRAEDQIYTRNKWNKISYSIKTRTNSELVSHRNRWYPSGVKIVPMDLKLYPTTILHWFIGDGTVQKTAYSTRIQIATHSFSFEENKFLCHKLNELGIQSLVKTHTRAGNYLSVRERSCLDFLDYIGQSPVSCYQYKWDKVVLSLTRSQAS